MGNPIRVKGPALPGVTIREATVGDADSLARNLRRQDREEIEAGSGESPLLVLLMGLKGRAYVACEDDEPFLIFGVTPDERDKRVGIIWLLGTDKTDKFPLTFLRQSKEWVEDLADGFDVLMNVIDERNKMHLGWLTWLGFEVVHRFPEYGKQGLPFLMFERRSACVSQQWQ